MNLDILFSRYTIFSGFCVGLLLLTVSTNSWLWLTAFATLLVAVMFVADRDKHYPMLIWLVGFNWLGAVASILAADLLGLQLADTELGAYRQQSVEYNLIALVVYATGIGWGLRVAGGIKRPEMVAHHQPLVPVVALQNAFIGYFASLMVAELVGYVVSNIPSLQQPLIGLYMLKYIFIYLVAITIFSEGRGYGWLVVMLAVEVVTGMTSFFGTFKESFFLVLIAFVAMRRRASVRMWVFGTTAALLVLMLSVLWTAVKPEYRRWVSGYTGEQIIVRSFEERATWMADHILDNEFDYSTAFSNMVDRIDSTYVLAQYLRQREFGDVIDLPSRYLGAIEHVLMPRILFPEKASLDDSAITTAMTGQKISDNTSISIGYLAEAHYDFGPQWMFLPILLIGVAIGLAARYFMTRAAPYVIRQAFATTLLFIIFPFGMNFDKALGTFLVGTMMFVLVLKFGYPQIAAWLSGRDPARAGVIDVASGE